jgi:hypothetical protein
MKSGREGEGIGFGDTRATSVDPTEPRNATASMDDELNRALPKQAMADRGPSA